MNDHRNLDDWARTEPDEAAALFDRMEAPWWIAGGHAIDLFLGQKLRDHEDLDVAVPRRDQLAVRKHLHEWDLRSCRYSGDPPPELTPWEHGRWVDAQDGSVWCRPTTDSRWKIEIVLLDVLENEWMFRRVPAVTLDLERVGRRTAADIPYLTPELALLFKAEVMRRRDQVDFEAAVPLMDESSRRWLAEAIRAMSPRHAWLSRL